MTHDIMNKKMKRVSRYDVHLSASVIVKNRGKILFVEEIISNSKKKEGRIFYSYSEPVGNVEPNESIPEAAIRETAEETGYKVKLTGLVGVYHVIHKMKKLNSAIRFVFEGKIMGRVRNWKPEKNVRPFWVDIKKVNTYLQRCKRPASKQAFKDFMQRGSISEPEFLRVVQK